MKSPSEDHAIQTIAAVLADLLAVPIDALNIQYAPHDGAATALVTVGMYSFVIEYKASGSAAPVDAAIERLRRHAASVDGAAVPIVVVPFMGDVGQQRCAAAGIAWMDLSGNVSVTAPGLRVQIEGRPNRYKRAGRPSSVFAPKSSRISRWLLMHPDQSFSQRQLSTHTSVDEGFTSRIVSRLEEDHLIVRGKNGEVHARDPALLLDAWRETYEFKKHRIIKGHVSSRTGDELLRKLVEWIGNHRDVDFAATGLAGAWLIDHFAMFRIATLYFREDPDWALLDGLGFREEPRGANVWFVVPNDEGVFQGASTREGVPCVHPLQVYLDLLAHPERATDAAERLRSTLVKTWEGSDA